MDWSISFNRYLLLALPLLGCISGCGKDRAKKKPFVTNSDSIAHKVSKLSDIPIPLGYTVVTATQEDRNEYLECKGTTSPEQLSSFYKQRMEEQGWNIKSLTTKHEGLLLCSKPFRLCTISIRPVSLHKKNQKNIASVHIVIHHENVKHKQKYNLDSAMINEKSIIR